MTAIIIADVYWVLTVSQHVMTCLKHANLFSYDQTQFPWDNQGLVRTDHFHVAHSIKCYKHLVFPQISFKDPSKKKCVKVRCMCIWSVFFAYVNLFLHHKIPWGIGLWKNPFIGWGNLFREVETLFWITSLMKDRSWSWIHIQMSPWLFLPNQALSWIPGFAFQEQKAMTGSIPECGSAMYSFPIAPVTNYLNAVA